MPWLSCDPDEFHTVPGPRDDTKTARNPSRGRGNYMQSDQPHKNPQPQHWKSPRSTFKRSHSTLLRHTVVCREICGLGI